MTDTVRETIRKGRIKSRYRICQDLGIDEGQMSRFMSGQRGFTLPVLDRLVDYLGLELRLRSGKERER